MGERFSTHATITFCADFDEALYPSAATPPMGYFVKKYEVDDQAAADPASHHVRYALEGMLNHPLAHAQLVPYESAESHQAFMKRFNQTMTLAVMFRDRPVGRVTPRRVRVRAGRGGPCRGGSTPSRRAPASCSRPGPAASSSTAISP